MKKIFFLLLIISSFTNAQTTEQLFDSANNFYKNGNYEKAIENYRKIEAKGVISSELFYNLGNTYYKLNKDGATIYNFEKALQINPLNEDAANNLVFAKRLTLDRIEELPKSVLQKFNENYLQKLSYNQWAIVTIIFAFFSAILFLLFYFSSSSSSKRVFFVTSILSFILCIVSISFTYNQYNYAQNTKFAIIFSEKTAIKNGPTLNSEEVFTLHEGTKVAVLDTVDAWKKIKLVDGKIGWVLAKEIKLLEF